MQVVDPMGQIDGWVDPEIKAMQDMIYGAVDASFDDRNRAKEGANFSSHDRFHHIEGKADSPCLLIAV